jgi:hypothetical protein
MNMPAQANSAPKAYPHKLVGMARRNAELILSFDRSAMTAVAVEQQLTGFSQF